MKLSDIDAHNLLGMGVVRADCMNDDMLLWIEDKYHMSSEEFFDKLPWLKPPPNIPRETDS